MKNQQKIIEWFLRIALSIGFLSAVADRFGFWPKEISTWGNWDNFVKYSSSLTPFLSAKLSLVAAIGATFLEILFGILLLTNFKTSIIAKASGALLICFGISMVLFNNVKSPLDYSVFTASAAAFALSIIYKK